MRPLYPREVQALLAVERGRLDLAPLVHVRKLADLGFVTLTVTRTRRDGTAISFQASLTDAGHVEAARGRIAASAS